MRSISLFVLVCLGSFCCCQVTTEHEQSQQCLGDLSLQGELLLMRKELDYVKENMKNEIDQLKAQLEVVETRVEQLTDEKQTQASTTFSAYGLHPTTDSVRVIKNRNDVIVYYHVNLNEGGHYNSSTGHYTCPTTGTYFFSFSVFGGAVYGGPTTSAAAGRLVKEGDYLDLVYFKNYNSATIDVTLGKSALIECSVGQRVWVESTIDNNYLWSSSRRNVFSGFLLYKK